MSHYSTIIFDLDGTLRFNRPTGLEAFAAFVAEHGTELTTEQLAAGERWAHAYWANTRRVNTDLALYDDKTFWLNYTREQLDALGVCDPDGRIVQNVHAAFETRYQPETYLEPSAHHVLSALRAGGFTLGLLSNRTSALPPLVAELELEGYLAFTLASGELGIWKPDPRIFIHACQMARSAPHTCVYVGDNYYADVVGALKAGLTPVLYDPRDVFPTAPCARIAGLAGLLEWLDGRY